MKVSIIGAGSMAGGIANRFASGGHSVTVSHVDLEKANTLVADLGNAPGARVEALPVDTALDNPVVVLAMPFAAARDFAERNAARLAGKIVVDISNPLNATYDGLVTAPGRSAAEEIAAILPKSKVVKAFNTTFAGTLIDGAVQGHALDVFIAGDDDDAKQVVIGLVRDSKLRPIDAGRLDRARQLEGLALLGITLQGPLGTGFMSAWKLVA
ncbi:MAG: NADPH-dependent F420 reductase [Bauldia sp.]